MSHKGILAFSLFVILYNFCIGYNTIYGLNKSIIEYFCIQKRPDNVDYRYQFNPGWVGTSVDNKSSIDPLTGFEYDFISPARGRVYGYNYQNASRSRDCQSKYCEAIYSPVVDFGSNFSLAYNKWGSYFKLECKAAETWIDLNETEYLSKSPGFEIDQRGFIKEQNFLTLSTGVNETKLTIMLCIFEKSPETCDIKKETEDSFAILFIILSCFFFVLSVLLVVFEKLNNSMVTRWAKLTIDYFRGMCNSKILFCNPMDGIPREVEEGHMFWTMTKNQFDADDYPHLHKVNEVKDLNGSYKFVDETALLIKIKGSGESELVELNNTQSEAIKNYFFMIQVSPSYCVSDPESKHYFKTRDVIHMVKNGHFFCREVSKKRTYCMSVDESEIRPIMETFMINEERAYRLLVHNKGFFGYYNAEALINCLKSKMRFWDKPSSVKNSQWKWYTSDFCKFMNKGGAFNYKSQCVWRNSEALNAAESSKVEIAPLKGDYTVNLTIGERTSDEEQEMRVRRILSESLGVIDTNYNMSYSLAEIGELKGDSPIETAIRESAGILKEAKLLRNEGSSIKAEEMKEMKKVDFPTVREMFQKKSDGLIKGVIDLVTNMGCYKDILMSYKGVVDPKVKKRIDKIEMMIDREKAKPEGKKNEKRIKYLKEDIKLEMRDYYKKTPYNTAINDIQKEINLILVSSSVNIVSYNETLKHLTEYEKLLEEENSPPKILTCNLSVKKLWDSVNKSFYVNLSKNSNRGRKKKRNTNGKKKKEKSKRGETNGKNKAGKKKNGGNEIENDKEENKDKNQKRGTNNNSCRIIKVRGTGKRLKSWAKSDFKAVVECCVDYINNSHWSPKAGVKKRSVFSMEKKIINFLKTENSAEVERVKKSSKGVSELSCVEFDLSRKIKEIKETVTKSRVMEKKSKEVYEWLSSKLF